MKKVILMRGLPGSGKSTQAKKILAEGKGQYKRVSKDDLRNMLDDGEWSGKNEKFIIKIRNSIILQAIEDGYFVIVDDTNLNPKHEEQIKNLVQGKAIVEIIDFTSTDLETCIKRDLRRHYSVGESVIRDMYNKYLRPEPPKIESKDNLPHAIICDLDGTLAILNGRNPYDASTCEKDEINMAVLETLKSFIRRKKDLKVLFVSGRMGSYRPMTENWLKSFFKHDYTLIMRKEGDMRKDSIIKKEIYESEIKDKYNIICVLDDRNQVVEMWRSLGLTCFQVAEGNF